MIPFLNLIVWVFLNTFGKPVSSFFPLRKESIPNLSEISLKAIEVQKNKPVAVQARTPVIPVVAPLKIETMRFSDTGEGKIIFADWRVEIFPHMTLVIKREDQNKTLTRYDANWNLQEFDYQGPKRERLHISLDDNKLHIVGETREGVRRERDYSLSSGYPWIQQVTLGFRNFALSNADTLNFYTLSPKDLSLMKLVAKKNPIEEVKGFGKLLKVEVKVGGLRSLFWSAEVWLHPTTGILYKMRASQGPFEPIIVTEKLQTDRLLESGRP
jgi:hypothetical protein